MRYKNQTQLVSNCEDHISTGIGAWWTISLSFDISRSISSISISKWQQELSMDFQLRSSTRLGYLREGHDKERWAYMT